MEYGKLLVKSLLVIFNLFYLNPIYASDHNISNNDVISRHDILKKIANKIYNQTNSIVAIQTKLTTEHGPNAKSIWQHYDRSMIGAETGKAFQTYEALKIYIQSNTVMYPQLQSMNTAKLKDLLGIKTKTFYTLTEINNLGTTITNAITNGSYGANPGGQSHNNKIFAITFEVNYGEICTRGNDNKATALSSACTQASRVIIVFEAISFFDKIISSNSWDSWEHDTSLKGKILSVYSE